MNEHSTAAASPDTFDGAAISRADREFLASLANHPLVRHPLYSVPPPPRPHYAGCSTVDEKAEVQRACFPAALDWMLVNYAYYTDAFMGKGGIISLVDGKMATIASLRASCGLTRSWKKAPRAGSRRCPSSIPGWRIRCARKSTRFKAVPTSRGQRSRKTA